MKIEIPIEIGDPIIKIEFNQHDGYYLEYDGFKYSHIPELNKTIFTTYADAKIEMTRLNSNRYHKS